MTLTSEKLTIKWLNFADYGEQITQFRHSIYIQEQGLNDGAICNAEDLAGLHLAAFIDNSIASIISGYFVAHNIMRFGMRMEHKSIRGSGLSELLCCHMGLSCYEVIKPQTTYVELFPKHLHLAHHYNRWGFHGPTSLSPGQQKLKLVCDGPEQQARQYRLNQRKLSQCRTKFPKIALPKLELVNVLSNPQTHYHQAS